MTYFKKKPIYLIRCLALFRNLNLDLPQLTQERTYTVKFDVKRLPLL